MTRTVLAAVDASAACGPVVAHARAFAGIVGGRVRAVHVVDEHERAGTARRIAEDVNAELRIVDGPVVETLLRLGAAPEVDALVIGAGGNPLRTELGHVARAVASRSRTPTLVVPPSATTAPTLRHILVPLEGSAPTTAAVKAAVDLLDGRQHPDLVMMHVYAPDTMPRYANHEPHETDVWMREFRDAYSPTRSPRSRLIVRVGRSDEAVRDVAEKLDVDLVVMAWSQDLGPGRASVVKAALGRYPSLLVPVDRAHVVTARRSPDRRIRRRRAHVSQTRG